MNRIRQYYSAFQNGIVCFLLLSISVTGFAIKQNEADPFAATIGNSNLDSARINKLLRQSEKFMEASSAKSMQYCNLALQLSEKSGYKRGEMLACYFKSNIYVVYLQQFDVAYTLIARANTIANQLNDSLLMGTTAMSTAYIFYSQQQFDKAITYYEEALQIYRAIKDYNRVALLHSPLMDIMANLGKFKESQKYFETGYALAKR